MAMIKITDSFAIHVNHIDSIIAVTSKERQTELDQIKNQLIWIGSKPEEGEFQTHLRITTGLFHCEIIYCIPVDPYDYVKALEDIVSQINLVRAK
jgi:hypothetical protein